MARVVVDGESRAEGGEEETGDRTVIIPKATPERKRELHETAEDRLDGAAVGDDRDLLSWMHGEDFPCADQGALLQRFDLLAFGRAAPHAVTPPGRILFRPAAGNLVD